jgi:AcrR family transcriptional regulator
MPTARSTPSRRERRRDGRRIGILRAAGRIFRERGFAESGMRDIAEAADLSPANLYHYFSGKDEILLFCQERTLERMLQAVAAARGSAPERLRAVLRAHVHSMLDETEGTVAHLDVESLPARMRAQMIEKRDAYERALRATVAEAMPGGDAALITRAMLGAVNWTARWYRSDGAQSVDSIADGLADYLVKGLT